MTVDQSVDYFDHPYIRLEGSLILWVGDGDQSSKRRSMAESKFIFRNYTIDPGSHTSTDHY